MGFKEWPSWLKGGLIGFVVSVILQLVPLIGFLIRAPVGLILLFILLPFVGENKISDDTAGILTVSLSLIFYFLIGALIGWIVGKMKSNQ